MYQLLPTIRLTLIWHLFITIFASKKVKMAKDVFNKKLLTADILTTSTATVACLVLHFIYRKSKKLVLALKSAGIPAISHNTSVFNLATPKLQSL